MNDHSLNIGSRVPDYFGAVL